MNEFRENINNQLNEKVNTGYENELNKKLKY